MDSPAPYLNEPVYSGSPGPRRRKKSRRWLKVLLVLIALLAVPGLYYYYPIKEQEPVVDIPTAVARRGDIEVTVTALGNLQPLNYVDVGAQVSGQLEKLHVNIGDTVEAGQMLAEIDPKVLIARVEATRAQLQSQKAQLAEQRAALELAEQQHQRQKKLLSDKATSQDTYQVSLAAVKTTQARIEALRAQIRETESSLQADEVTLGYTKIHAPMSGTVVDLPARQGQMLNANLSAPVILRIADLSTMTVWTQVSEADVPKLQIGMNAYFTILGKPGLRWSGKLRQILPTPEIINNVVLYTALFDVENPERQLMTRMTAQVFFVIDAAYDVITVPVSALQDIDRKSGHYRVIVLGNDGAQTAREVRIGLSNRVSAQIVSGLREGERIVDNPLRPTSAERRYPFRIF